MDPDRALVEAAHAAGVPVIFTRFAYRPDYSDGGLYISELQPVLRKTVTWNVERDFVPVIMFGTQPIVIATYTASPYKSIKDLVAAAKAKPGSIGYAT